MMKKILTCFACLFLTGYNSAMAHDFSWENLVHAAIKLDSNFDYQANVNDYMQSFRKDVWNTYRNDEFELEDKRNETIDIMKEKSSAFDLDENFTIVTGFKFGDYDFSKESFPLTSLTPSTYFYDTDYSGDGNIPYKYHVFFSNTDIITDLDMPKDEARSFLNARKNRHGNVDRSVVAKIDFKIVKLKSRDSLIADIQKVTLYSDNERSKVLQEY